MNRNLLLLRSMLMALLLVIGAQGAMAENAIYGSWSNYQTKNTVANNKVTIHLEEDHDYWFYLWDSNNSSAKFCNSGTMTNTNNSGWKFTSTETTYCGIHTDKAGDYVFNVEWKQESGAWYPYISVTYPSGGSSENYTITINSSPSEGGCVKNASTTITSIEVGSTGKTLTAVPNSGYKFTSWSATGGAVVANPTSATTTITATAAGTVTANFEQSSTPTPPTPTPSNTDYAYYLIGNFMNTDGDNINMTNLIFRFNQTGVKTYTFDVPATLEVKSQIYSISAEGVETVYGPTSNTEFSISNNDNANYDLAANSNYFIAHDRTLDSDGMYTYTLTVNDEGIPTSVNVKHTQLTRVAYFLPDATDATAQPAYSTRNNVSSAGDNKYFGSVNLQKNQKCFVISNIRQEADDANHHGLRYTQNKLYRQGNGGGDVIDRKNQPDGVDYTKVYPVWANTAKNVSADGFTFGGQAAAYTLEYNPSKGKDDVVKVSENALIGGEVLRAEYGDLPVAINSINIVGTGITGSFDLNTKVPMTYNQTLKCYEYTFDSSSEESKTNLFRFVANDSWAINWGEESTSADDHAKVPYQGTGAGHSAMPDDPNVLKQYNSWTEGTGMDIIFNRPAGHWTIRFYIVTESASGGNGYTNKYYYTINGTESFDIPLTLCNGKFIRTYSNDDPMNLTDGVKAYIAYKFEQPQNPEDNYAACKVYLRQMEYIPANVGVVLVGQVPGSGSYSEGDKLNFSLQKRVEAVPENLCEVWVKYASYTNDKWHNFLVPTVTAVNNLGNAEVNGNGDIIERYFGLGNYHSTAYFKNGGSGADYIGFFRLTEKGKSGANKAYLSIPSSKNTNVTDPDKETYGVLDFNAQLSGQETDEENPSLAKAMIFFDDEDFDDAISTSISSVNANTSNDRNCYTLQGIKVMNPTKGLYIKNGKKYIFK